MTELTQQRKELVASLMKGGIYKAAVEVLMQHGSDGLTMDRVAEAAGVAKGSLYNYFRNKRELIEFIHEKAIEPARIAVQQHLADTRSAPEKLEAILRTWFEHFATNRGVFNFLFNDPHVREVVETRKKSHREKGLEDLRLIFQQGITEGSFRRFDAGRAAEMFLGAVMISVEQQTALDQRRPVDESVGTLMDLFLRGLEPRST